MKKRVLSIMLAALMIVSQLHVTALAAAPANLGSYFTGTGVEVNPYKLGTVSDLEKLADIVNGGESCTDTYFELTADIGDTTTPVTKIIGSASRPFNGHFNGNGHMVKLNITSDSANVGMFGILGSSATIEKVKISGSVHGITYVGGLCGYNNGGNITGCENSSCVVTGSSYIGGLCGYNEDGNIDNCNNFRGVTAFMYCGGVCGTNKGGNVSNCYSIGTMIGNSDVGGICGENRTGGRIINCNNSGSVLGADNNADNLGGICGDNVSGSSIINCSNAADVSGDTNIGGICGYNSGSSIINCYNSNAVTGTIGFGNTVGGVCGNSSNGTITDCYYDKEVCSKYEKGAQGAVKGADVAANRVLGLSTAQCKGAKGDKFNTDGVQDPSGTERSLIDILNGYETYLSGWKSWDPVISGYPTSGHIHDFSGELVQGTGNNAGKHGRKCLESGCTIVGDYVACSWEYGIDTVEADSDTLTATCKICEKAAALTLHSPSGSLVYNGSAIPAEFNSTEKATWNKFVGSVPEIHYHDDTNDADMGTTAPINVGTYTAKITAGTGEGAKTAQVSYSIQKKDLYVQVLDKSATVGDASAPGLDNPEENTDYKFLQGPVSKDSENITVSLSYVTTPDLSVAGTTEITANISGTAAGNYELIVIKGTLTVSAGEHTHSYGEATYIWHDGLSKCTAIKTCTCGNAVIETVDVDKSGTTLTADFSAEFTDQTKTVEEATHNHIPELVNGQTATCTADGWKDYYKCSDSICNKLFSDPACTNEITDFDTWKTGSGKIAVAGHKAVNIPEKAATETAYGYMTYWYCPICDSYFTDAACTQNIGNIDTWKNGDGKIDMLTAHEHTFENDWSSNACAHWYASTCTHDGYSVIKDEGEHNFDGGVSVTGGTKYTCQICGYTKTVSETGIKVDVVCTPKMQRQYIGWWPFGYYRNTISYVYNIKTTANDVKISKVEYKLNGRWYSGKTLTSRTKLKCLDIRVTDADGVKHIYKYDGTKVIAQ